MGSLGLPLALTCLGALGTGLGGLMVVLQPSMCWKRLGALQGLAAGLMLSISLMDLLPEAAEEIGFLPAQLCFYAGVLFFAAIVALIPEPDAVFAAGEQQQKQDKQEASLQQQPQQSEKLSQQQAATLRRRSNSAVVAPTAAVLDRSCPGYMPPAPLMQPHQQQQDQALLSPPSPASSSGGSTDMQVLLQVDGGSDKVSGSSGSSKEEEQQHKRQLLMSGLITAVGIALHNAPEGVAVMLASHKSTGVGVSLAAAIALHNIPEGVAVALPVYFATGSRWRGLQAAVLSGLAEPLAVILLGLFLPFLQLDKHLVDCMLAGVGGIMAFLAFHELLPLSIKHAGVPLATGCLFAGMGLMSVTLHTLNTHVLADLH